MKMEDTFAEVWKVYRELSEGIWKHLEDARTYEVKGD